MPEKTSPSSPPLPDLVSLKELAAMLKISGVDLRRLIKKGKFPRADVSMGPTNQWWRRERVLAWLGQQIAQTEATHA